MSSEKTPRILIVDDDRVTRALLEEILVKEGYGTDTADSAESALEKVRANGGYDLVLSDIRMGGKSGLDLLREIRKTAQETEVILITGFGSMETAVEAVHDGAFDYISKPFKIDEIKLQVKRAINQRALLRSAKLEGATALEAPTENIVGRSPSMIKVFTLVARVAPGRSTVLITGENGTGKEVIAREIHKLSPRREKRIVTINTAAIPEGLIESELFGHVKGAFTSAVADKPGAFEAASGGTLFLDEVGDMPLIQQARLLRALESGEITRVGSNTPIKVDVRIIAATNKNLTDMVKEGTFREDLYFRLNVVTIEMPPLRERKDDIPLLAEYFLAKHAHANVKQVLGIAKETLDLLVEYPWPGNVRELANVIDRAVTLSGKPLLLPDDEVERDYILEVLSQTRGNKQEAARILHIDRKTLQRKLKEYHLDSDERKDDDRKRAPEEDKSDESSGEPT
ncbi:sigma-54-dependent Fis family transcriptional regulator [bacterium]|nr:sigma-54-dependent Fis family transcriptional regulator [bacterium]